MTNPVLQKAGSVNIKEIKLISSNDLVVDLNEFLVELNIYEDLFSPTLYGDIMLSDSRNLIDTLPIIGEEHLTLEIVTPGFEDQNQVIRKTFRVFKLSGRNIVRDNNTQTFVLHFASVELFYDMLLPIYKSFTGNISELVKTIFFDYIAASQTYKLENNDTTLSQSENTPLVIINETANDVKFVSPGWTPIKCINWLASKAIPLEGNSKNFIFYESNKSFYFGSLEYIFKDAIENKNIVGVYSYSPNNFKVNKSRDIVKEFFTISDIQMVSTTDHIKNYTNGYLSNRLITLDVHNKVYNYYDYDYVEDYKNNYHTSGEGDKAEPVFSVDSPRNAYSSTSFYPINPKLFNNFKDNVSEKMPKIYGNRKSSMLGLTNIKLNVTIPGRTDIEAGNMIYLKFPALGPTSSEDSNADKFDKSYSGYYIITAMHHRITITEHVIIAELVKDSIRADL